jgi:hypothetical protein
LATSNACSKFILHHIKRERGTGNGERGNEEVGSDAHALQGIKRKNIFTGVGLSKPKRLPYFNLFPFKGWSFSEEVSVPYSLFPVPCSLVKASTVVARFYLR